MYRPPSDRPERRATASDRRGLVGTLPLAAAVPLVLHTATRPAAVAIAVAAFLCVLRLARTTTGRPAHWPERPRRADRRPEVAVTAADRRR